MTFYTRKGDDGTTGLFYGGRVAKNDAAPNAYGAVDEAQSFLGLARAEAERGGELDEILIRVERDLYVLMTELATAPDNHHKLKDGQLTTEAMVAWVEETTDELLTRFEMPKEFVLPGQNRIAALLEVGRTVIRRAEREALPVAVDGSSVIPYLNRLSSLLWVMARWQEGGALPAKPRE